MTTAVTGIYSDSRSVESAIGQLVAAGFPRDEISVILRVTPDHERLVHEETEDTPRGVLTGVIGGGVLASLAFGLLALPGIGVLAAGPLLVALTAGGAGAAAASTRSNIRTARLSALFLIRCLRFGAEQIDLTMGSFCESP